MLTVLNRLLLFVLLVLVCVNSYLLWDISEGRIADSLRILILALIRG